MSTSRRYSKDQKMSILNDMNKGLRNVEICKKYGISSSSVSTIRIQFAAKGLLNRTEPSEKELLLENENKRLENENKRLKELLGEKLLEISEFQRLLKKAEL
jgi:Transposase.